MNVTWFILTGVLAVSIPCIFATIGFILPKAWVKAYKKRDKQIDVMVTFLSLSIWIIFLTLIIDSHNRGAILIDATYFNESLIEIILLSFIILTFGVHGSFQVGLWRGKR